jgi:carbamoyl-phosphate synthase small subunit
LTTSAVLALEDGSVFKGISVGAAGQTVGEVVFNTSMTGYQEVLTDPSYSGQIVTMTCPEIGNYGVSPEDVESRGAQVAGFIIRDESPVASNSDLQPTDCERLRCRYRYRVRPR